MGLFGKGLIGLIMENKRQNEIRRMLSNSASYGESSQESLGRNSYKTYHCRYCGRRTGRYAAPNPRDVGKCPNSTYGTHYWMEY